MSVATINRVLFSSLPLMFFYFYAICVKNSFICYLPLGLIAIFFVSLGAGIGTIFNVILGEKLPAKSRTLTIPAIMVVMELWDAVQNFAFNPLQTVLGENFLPVLFAFHSVTNALTLLVIVLFYSKHSK